MLIKWEQCSSFDSLLLCRVTPRPANRCTHFARRAMALKEPGIRPSRRRGLRARTPLAPESSVEQVLPFVQRTYENLLRHAPKGVALFGDSSGCGLAVALYQGLRDMQAPLPIKLMLISPWLDVTCSDPRQAALDREDPILAPLGLIEEGRWVRRKTRCQAPECQPSVRNFRIDSAHTGAHGYPRLTACGLAET